MRPCEGASRTLRGLAAIATTIGTALRRFLTWLGVGLLVFLVGFVLFLVVARLLPGDFVEAIP